MKPLTADTIDDRGCENLAAAIVLTACTDLRRAHRALARGEGMRYTSDWRESNREIKDECISFFRSKWFGVLCNLDPDKVIQASMYGAGIGKEWHT